jgi:O-succinylbenzoic acid--CoA ligase
VTDIWRSVGPGDLVAVEAPPGPFWTSVVRGAWESGAAILPLDMRLTPADRTALLERAHPTHRLNDEGLLLQLHGGVPAAPGLALLVATSGTSGRSKLVELTRDAIESALHGAAERIGSGRWLMCLTPAHIAGLLVLLRGVVLGPSAVVHPSFDAAAVGAEPNVEYVSIVPTMLFRLLEAGADLTRFRTILVGGAPMPAGLRERAEDAGATIVNAYGLTETAGGLIYEGLPLRDIEVRLGESDEVQVRGPVLLRAYLGDEEATAGAHTPDGWFRTADAGRVDDEGRLEILGRLDDAIVTGAQKVWPAEVEDVLRDHPGVADLALAGRPDPEWGHRAVAFVIPADPAEPPTLDDLREFGRDRLAAYKLPREVVLVEALPRTASGKIARKRLGDSG